MMSLGTKVAQDLPFLRRYARALTGSQLAGDNYVRATLEAALADEGLEGGARRRTRGALPVFNQVWSAAQAPQRGKWSRPAPAMPSREDQLQKITPLSRQALLLTTLEEFSSDRCRRNPRPRCRTKWTTSSRQAIEEIERETSANVLIIEDEPLISMQLEELVRSLGHDVCGTAATRTQAQAIVAKEMPSLVLADIQLADGSSGLDAVDDILSLGEVPVIFITAYPERLLTGHCREPTYLVTKPFREASVRAAISQALFFDTGASE